MAGIMRISLDQIVQTAKTYEDGTSLIETVITDTDRAMNTLQEGWVDANQQTFYEYQKELSQYLQGCAEIMKHIARDLKAIALRYEAADADQIPKTKGDKK
jgi:WXG100 family type VII secretion target